MATPNQDKLVVFKEAVEKNAGGLAKIAPAHIKMERQLRMAQSALIRNPDLLQCTVQSFIQSVAVATELGLDLSGALGEAYLVPFGQTCTLIPGYRGMKNLAMRTGKYINIDAHIIYANDEFSYTLGAKPEVNHKPAFPDRGEMIGAYAVALPYSGVIQPRVMNKQEVDDVRKHSKAANKGPWVTDYIAMARKTPLKALFNYLEASVEMMTAVELDNRAETGEGVGDLIDLDSKDVTVLDEKPNSTATERLEEKVGARRGGRPVGSKNKPKPAPGDEDPFAGATPHDDDSEPTEAEKEYNTKKKLVAEIQKMGLELTPEKYREILAIHGAPDNMIDMELADLGMLKAAMNRAVDAKNQG